MHGYTDEPVGIGESMPDGTGRFVEAVLHPHIAVANGTDMEIAGALHARVHDHCFVARSVAFPVRFEPTYASI